MGGKPSPGTKKDKRLKDNKTSSSSSTARMPRTIKQMNAQHKRMTGGRKS